MGGDKRLTPISCDSPHQYQAASTAAQYSPFYFLQSSLCDIAVVTRTLLVDYLYKSFMMPCFCCSAIYKLIVRQIFHTVCQHQLVSSSWDLLASSGLSYSVVIVIIDCCGRLIIGELRLMPSSLILGARILVLKLMVLIIFLVVNYIS